MHVRIAVTVGCGRTRNQPASAALAHCTSTDPCLLGHHWHCGYKLLKCALRSSRFRGGSRPGSSRLQKLAIIGGCVSTPDAAAEDSHKPLAPAHEARYASALPPPVPVRSQKPCIMQYLCPMGSLSCRREASEVAWGAASASTGDSCRQAAPCDAAASAPGKPARAGNSRHAETAIAAEPAACTPHPCWGRQPQSRPSLPALCCAPDALRVLGAGPGNAEDAGALQGGAAGGTMGAAPGPQAPQLQEHRLPGAGTATAALGSGQPPSPPLPPGTGLGLPSSVAASAALPPVAPHVRHAKQAHARPQGTSPPHGALQQASPGANRGTESSPAMASMAATAPLGASPGASLHKYSPGSLLRTSPGHGARPPGAGSPADPGALPRFASPPPWAGEGGEVIAGLGHGAGQAASASGGSGRASRGSADGSDGGDGIARRLASLLRPSGELGLTR